MVWEELPGQPGWGGGGPQDIPSVPATGPATECTWDRQPVCELASHARGLGARPDRLLEADSGDRKLFSRKALALPSAAHPGVRFESG